MISDQGCVDLCQQGQMAGWATKGGNSAELLIFCNGKKIGECKTDFARPDVSAAIGCDEMVGFSFHSPHSPTASDRIEIRIAGTDCVISAEPHDERVSRLTTGIKGRGLELGALDNPFLDKKNFDVLYVDHASRRELIDKYISTGSVSTIDPMSIVETDIIWTPSKSLATSTHGRRFDYAIASQVMEHVADPIGWLNEISECLRPGARINLTLPDMRRTFDHCRRLSTAADMLEAFENRARKPGFRVVFDHIANVINPPNQPDYSEEALRQAYEVAKIAEGGAYFDVHCHVWTSDSFAHEWSIIEKLGVCKARIDKLWHPVSASNEFIVSFVT